MVIFRCFEEKLLWLPYQTQHKLVNQGCGIGYFVNRFRTYRFRFQQSLDSISSMNILTRVTIKTSSKRFTRAHY